MGSRERMFLLVFGGILALVFGWAEETRGQPRETIEGAKKESEMVFYSGMVVQDTQVLLSAFEKKNPFIKATHYRASGPPLIARIQSEYRAGLNLKDHTAVRNLSDARLR